MNTAMLFQIIVLFGVLLLFLFLGFPTFLSMAISVLSFWVLWPHEFNALAFGQGIIKGLSDQNFVACCFYFLLGDIMSGGTLGDRMVTFLKAAIGHIPGGIAHVNILSSMVFAGVSGSSVADTASVGAMSLNAMKKSGFPADFSATLTAMTAIIGPIIPPSGGLVMMAVYLGCSARKMFIGGIVPGVLMGILYMALTAYLSIKRNYPRDEKFCGWKKLWEGAKIGFGAFLLPALVIIALLAGFGTVVEIGACSVFVAILLEIVYREFSWKKLLKMIMNTAIMATALISMISMSGVFTWILSSLGIASWVAAQVTALGMGKTAIMMMCFVLFMILGCLLPVSVILYVIVPVIAPIVLACGIDPIYFGVVVTLIIQIGLNTPPVGTLIYMTAQIAECNAADVIKQNVPYLVLICGLVIAMILCPGIVTWLPNLIV